MSDPIDTEMPSSPPHERWCWHYITCGDQPCDCGAAVSPKENEHG